MRVVYFDNNATTAVAPEVFEAMLPYLKGEYFNPSSAYDPARGPRDAVERAREWAAQDGGTLRLPGCPGGETSGQTAPEAVKHPLRQNGAPTSTHANLISSRD